MKNRMIITLLLGLSACGAYAGDAYDPLYPQTAMNPWKSTKGEIAIRKRRLATANRKLAEQDLKSKASNAAMQGIMDANKDRSYDSQAYANVLRQDAREAEAISRKWRQCFAKQDRAYWNYLNTRYDSQPTFPRSERISDRIRNWFNSWYR